MRFNTLCAFFFFFLCFPVLVLALPQEAQQQINDFSLIGYGEKGKKSWDIAGKTADIFDEVVKLKNVSGNLYGKEEDVNLTAKSGDFNRVNGRVYLKDDVVITTSKGAKLTTDSMDWDRKNQVVATEDKVNINKDNVAIVGTGAQGVPSLNKVTLKKDVRVDINPDTAKKPAAELDFKDKVVITCDGRLVVDYEKNVASFYDNVIVERPDLVIYSDKLDLYFLVADGKLKSAKSTKSMASSIDRIVASGNVRIVRGENVSYSQEAVYNARDKKIILSGKPKLTFYSGEEFKDASFGN